MPTKQPDEQATATPGGTTTGGTSNSTPTETGEPTAASSTTPPPESAGATPTAATAQGRLVEGFPALLTPPPGAAIERSSVSSNDGDQQATLVLSGDPRSALQHYRAVLRAHGYVEQSRGVDDHLSTAFMKDEDTVVLTTIDAKTYLVADLHHGSG